MGAVTLENPQGHSASFELLSSMGTEFFQTHQPLVLPRAYCFGYRVFTMHPPRSTSQQDLVIRHCWLHALLLPHKDLKRIAQRLRETSVRDLSLRLPAVLIPF